MHDDLLTLLGNFRLTPLVVIVVLKFNEPSLLQIIKKYLLINNLFMVGWFCFLFRLSAYMERVLSIL